LRQRLLPGQQPDRPYNLYARTRQLLRQAPRASTAHDIGFRFGPPPAGGQPMTFAPGEIWIVLAHR